MDTKKLEMWAKLLLDTGKRNNLVNFKDTKASTVEVVLPEISSVFQKLENETTFEVYDPKLTEEEDEDYNNKIKRNWTNMRQSFIVQGKLFIKPYISYMMHMLPAERHQSLNT